jgi:hypothetical protein
MQFHSTVNSENIQLSARSWFQRRMRPLAIAAGLVAIVALSFGPLGASNEQELQGSDGPQGCTPATLRGRYLFAESGVLLPPAFGVAAPTQAADAGVEIFNGDGTGTNTVTFRVGANPPVLENVVAPVQYVVRADCTGQITVLNGPSFDIFVAPDGSEFARIATAPLGNYPAAIDRRVSRK